MGGILVEKFDKYWEAEVVEKNEDNSYTFKYTTGESETKELGNPIPTVNGNEAPEIFTEDEYFDGTFDISNEVYEFAEDFRQEWLAARYQRGAAPDPVGANIYYIYGAIEGGFDWYWQAKKDGEVSITRGNQNDTIHKFTYTSDGNPVYVLDSSAQITITQYNQPRQFFSAAEYFNGTFKIYNYVKYNFTDKFKKKWQAEQAVWLESEYNESFSESNDAYVEIYYIYELRDGFDKYWEAIQSGKGGNINQYTYTDGSKSIYVQDAISTDMIESTTGSPVRKIFTRDEYFGGPFNINNTNSYKFTPEFIIAYNIAQEKYKEVVAFQALSAMSGGNMKLRF